MMKATEKQVDNHRRASYTQRRSFSRHESSCCSHHEHDETEEILEHPAFLEEPEAPRKRNVLDVLNELQSSSSICGKKILIRVDFNVPMDKTTGEITDDSRIRGALPTIKAVLKFQCNAVLVSHMGRPKLVQKSKDPKEDDAETAKQRKQLSLQPVADRLAKLLEKPVLFAEDCMMAKPVIAQLPASGGGIVLLNNLRFYKQEEKNDPDFASTLASYADAYVNDAFGTCHRAHASVAGVPALLPPKLCGIGCLVASELSFLDFQHVDKDNSTIAAIIGGSKVSTKLPVIKGLLDSVDILVLGGGLAFTFLKAKGINIGNSLLEPDLIETAKQLMADAATKGKKIVLPVDAVCAREFPQGPGAETKTFDVSDGSAGIEDGWMGLDAGPNTVEAIGVALQGTTKLVCNGPLGVFEIPPFDAATRGLVAIMKRLTQEGTVTVVGGGDSVAALEAFGETHSVSYVSTGGGAALELLAGDVLPGVAAIADYQA